MLDLAWTNHHHQLQLVTRSISRSCQQLQLMVFMSKCCLLHCAAFDAMFWFSIHLFLGPLESDWWCYWSQSVLEPACACSSISSSNRKCQTIRLMAWFAIPLWLCYDELIIVVTHLLLEIVPASLEIYCLGSNQILGQRFPFECLLLELDFIHGSQSSIWLWYPSPPHSSRVSTSHWTCDSASATGECCHMHMQRNMCAGDT